MRTDIATAFPAGRKMETPMPMAKKQAPVPQQPHHVTMGDAAHLGMRHLSATGMQAVAVAEQAIDFAELQDEGPTARAPRPHNSNRFRG